LLRYYFGKATEPCCNEGPPEEFGIRAFCTACDHQAWLDRAALPETLLVRRVTERLRCTVCGSKGAEIRIVYRGAGDFHWGYPAERSG